MNLPQKIFIVAMVALKSVACAKKADKAAEENAEAAQVECCKKAEG